MIVTNLQRYLHMQIILDLRKKHTPAAILKNKLSRYEACRENISLVLCPGSFRLEVIRHIVPMRCRVEQATIVEKKLANRKKGTMNSKQKGCMYGVSLDIQIKLATHSEERFVD